MTKADVYEEAALKIIGKLLGVHYRRSKSFQKFHVGRQQIQK